MKNFIYGCIGFIVGLIVFAFAAHFGVVPPPGGTVQSDEESVEQTAQEVETFYDVNEFLNFVGDIRNIHTVDSILITAPAEQIINISHVCLKKYGKIDRETFYQEYRQNDTYKYLPNQQQQQKYLQQEATPADNQGGNQAITIRPDTIASVSVTKEGTTKVE